MKKIFIVSLLSFLVTSNAFAEKAPQKIIDLANTKLAKIGSEPVIVEAVKEQNAKGQTLEQVMKLDEKWKNTPGIADYMKALMESECAKYLRSIQNKQSYYSEIFVMDKLGANVAMTDKTSDYYQGDEAKFKNSYNDGKGAVFVDDVEFDDSSQAYLVQVSVPVKDGDKVIGAITFGIDVDKVEQ